jgi:hypothetical protein
LRCGRRLNGRSGCGRRRRGSRGRGCQRGAQAGCRAGFGCRRGGGERSARAANRTLRRDCRPRSASRRRLACLLTRDPGASGRRPTIGHSLGLGDAIVGDRVRNSWDASLGPVPNLLGKGIQRLQSRRSSWRDGEDAHRQDHGEAQRDDRGDHSQPLDPPPPSAALVFEDKRCPRGRRARAIRNDRSSFLDMDRPAAAAPLPCRPIRRRPRDRRHPPLTSRNSPRQQVTHSLRRLKMHPARASRFRVEGNLYMVASSFHRRSSSCTRVVSDSATSCAMSGTSGMRESSLKTRW